MLTIDFLKKHNLILFECISGSRAYGLATENSDTDIRGVFYLPKDMFYGLEYTPQVSNETNDIVYYELGRFLELLSKNNPNILEMLATPEKHILVKHSLMNYIKMEDFLSKLIKDTFVGYAFSQIKKATGLNKKMFEPMDSKRKSVLDFCYILIDNQSVLLVDWLQANDKKQTDFGLTKIPHFKDMFHLFESDANFQYRGIISNSEANDVQLSSISKFENPFSVLMFHRDAYSSYCKKYREYWDWMEKRNEERYHNNANHKKGYDAKNMMHTIRLLEMALGILKDNKLNIEVSNREELLKIKSGFYTYDEVLAKAEILMNEISQYTEQTSLQEKPNIDFVEKLLVNLRLQIYH